MSGLVIVALAFCAGLLSGAIIASVVKSNMAAEKRLNTIAKLERKAYLSRAEDNHFNLGRASGLESAIMLLSSET